MREWNLGPGDPLELTLSADFRLSPTDFANDHIWELSLSGGEPPALALHTTYGLRARTMRIFPRFTAAGQTVSDPAGFARGLRVRRFQSNFLLLDCSPFEAIDVTAEYWVPGSHTCAGRFSLTNHSQAPIPFQLELCVQLVPLDEGQPMSPLPMQSINVLAGQTGGLTPVVFLTGGPQPGSGPYPSLAVSRPLEPGETRTLTWAQAAEAGQKESLELARLTAARPWEAARARIELVNAAQMVEVFTGDSAWDAALALSQKTAFRLFFGPSDSLKQPAFIASRQPDHGYSPKGDGSDYPPSWSGPSALDATYMAGLLPGAPDLAEGLLRNFLSAQVAEGSVPWKTGPGPHPGRWLAAPLLASLAWQVYQSNRDVNFLREVQPALATFLDQWLSSDNDRDGDGFPEWAHPLQTGFEADPAWSAWQPGGQGAPIWAAEDPALAAMLVRDLRCLGEISAALGLAEEQKRWTSKANGLCLQTEECWNGRASIYRSRDRDSHLSPAGKVIGTLRGPGSKTFAKTFKEPQRLLVRLELTGPSTGGLQVSLSGRTGETPQSETLERADFQWGLGFAVAASRGLYTALDELRLTGVDKRDRLVLQSMDLSGETITRFLPLWAGIPDPERAARLAQSLLAADRFGKPFGAPACPRSVYPPGGKKNAQVLAEMDPICQAVHLPWNSLAAEGLLGYGMRTEAAQLCYRLMTGVIRSLQKSRAFFDSYHALTGEGLGERGGFHGLAPLGLFLRVLGLRILSPRRIELSGKNPYPWPVTVKYRGLAVTRQAEQTVVVFPNGQTLTLPDPTDAVVSID